MRAASRSSSSEEIRGTLKKRFDQMSQRRAARHLAGNAGDVNVSQALFFMTNVAFLFEHPELRAHGRIIWLLGQSREHFSHRGAFELVKNIHDLAFAPRKRIRFWLSLHLLSRHAMFVACVL